MQLYCVGGAVRDRLLNIASTDTDWLIVGADKATMLDLGFNQVGKDFPVFLHPRTKAEYSLARVERKQFSGYHGFACEADKNVTLAQDLKRRDLTINALALDCNNKVIDYYGGLKDLENRVLRHVSSAFAEDPLRLLRVARFYGRLAYLGFKVHASTMEELKNIVKSNEILALSKHRIATEFMLGMACQSPEKFVEVLISSTALSQSLGIDIRGDIKENTELTHLCYASNLVKNATIRFIALLLDIAIIDHPQQAQQISQKLQFDKNTIKLSKLILQTYHFIHNKKTYQATDLLGYFTNLLQLQKTNNALHLEPIIKIATVKLGTEKQNLNWQRIQQTLEELKAIRPDTNTDKAEIGQYMQQQKIAVIQNNWL